MDRRSLVAMLMAGTAASLAAMARANGFAMTDAQWRQKLSPMAYRVLRKADTERPFTSALLNEHRRGRFACAG
jgi:peptide-methionine (R)-S-oxide reductase